MDELFSIATVIRAKLDDLDLDPLVDVKAAILMGLAAEFDSPFCKGRASVSKEIRSILNELMGPIDDGDDAWEKALAELSEPT